MLELTLLSRQGRASLRQVLGQRLALATVPARPLWSAGHVAGCYEGLISALAIDEADVADADAVAEHGITPLVTRTLMSEPANARALVETLLGLVPSR